MTTLDLAVHGRRIELKSAATVVPRPTRSTPFPVRGCRPGTR
ncbi:hypothetical protein [Streptomyces sp. NBC_01643]|nr:hypothetical protein OHB03_09240 [Streptomyces sp. NBC_01643]